MDMPVLLRNQIPFSQTSFTREPLPINLAELQRRGHRTLEEYLGYVFAETKSELVLPVLDKYLFPLVLVIESVDGKAISGFWQSSSCGQHCDKKERPHPCADNDSDTVDCDLFCSGISINTGDDETDRTRDLTRHSLCHTDHQGELTTCGILSITLHHHRQPDRARLVGIELLIGCSDTQQSVFVVQCHTGLKISLK
jgi:hypothetical protein